MADKNLTKDTFSKDMDDTIDAIFPTMIMMMMFMFMIPMLPIVQSAQSYIRGQQFEGESDPRTLKATQKAQHIVLDTPWIGAYFINDGPNNVQLKINDEGSNPFTMGPLETITLSRKGAETRIYAVYYQCSGGETASVRVFGIY